MALSSETPVTYIQGIGPAAADALKAIGVETVLDLLKHQPDGIHLAVSTQASLQQVTAWRAMAVLLQIGPLTPPWAEWLVGKQITTLGELSRQPLLDLLRLFDEGASAGAIGSVPGLSDASRILVDATSLHLTGAVSGRVVDATGAPALGATARLGHLSAPISEQGRFRLLRVSRDWTAPLVVEWDAGDRSYVFDNAVITRNADTVVETELTLPVKWADALPAAGPALSELAGDVLPQLAGHHVRNVDQGHGPLRDRDLLVVDYLYETAPEAKLASRLRRYAAGEVHVYTYRVPLTALPAGVRKGDNFRVRRGTLEPATVTPYFLHAYRANLRAAKPFQGQPRPTTRAEKQARYLEIDAFVRRETFGDRDV